MRTKRPDWEAFGAATPVLPATATALRAVSSAHGRRRRCLAALGRSYAAAGLVKEAEAILGQLRQLSKTVYISDLSIATIYTALGNKEQSLAFLEAAFKVRDPEMVRLKRDPSLDPLRSDQRFQDLLRRMNFPQ